MSDSDEASLLCESKSEDHETVDYDTILDLVEQLRRQSKGRSTSCSLCVCYTGVHTDYIGLPDRKNTLVYCSCHRCA